jgi:hypothetical protein
MTMGLFAAMALTLASVGIYGVIAYTVGQRTQEVGIRIALRGNARANPPGVLAARNGAHCGGAGTGSVGRRGAHPLSLQPSVRRVTATDPTTFMVISLLLTVVAAAACYLPARRAAKLDPTYALREE